MATEKHIDWGVLLDHLEARSVLPPEQQKHLEGCELCRNLRREAENLLGTLELASTPDPTPELVEKAWMAIRDQKRAQRTAEIAGRVTDALKEIWATLSPTALAPTHAVRGVSAAAPRLLVYEAGDFVVSVTIKEKDHATQNLLGKVVPKSSTELPKGSATLQSGDAQQQVELGPNGGFRFDGVPRGEIRVDLTVGDTVIHLPVIGSAESGD